MFFRGSINSADNRSLRFNSKTRNHVSKYFYFTLNNDRKSIRQNTLKHSFRMLTRREVCMSFHLGGLGEQNREKDVRKPLAMFLLLSHQTVPSIHPGKIRLFKTHHNTLYFSKHLLCLQQQAKAGCFKIIFQNLLWEQQ